MTFPNNGKRAICKQCSYPQSTCLCEWVCPIDNPLNIIILQHNKEARHAKNTVKLLKLGLKNITVRQGESPQDWPELVTKVTETPQKYNLCYPHDLSQPIESAKTTGQQQQLFSKDHQFIFIDASWRKALKMWHLNPWLKKCNSWHFSQPPASQYQIRHTTQKNSLSTLESVAYVLSLTHNQDCSSLLTLFSKMQEKCFVKKERYEKE